ncbi:MAG: Stp1/IreP family PP2C-type Ser/Thr phosphatase [Oscillospiraceae bacterium]|nr:Stp1/IreP family PP2C-type Ser/Thr phosphatase [Oscillospiraceae bacterium]
MERRNADMINVWGLTDIGLVRKENQDAYAVQRNEESGHLIAVVCDGMGGAKGGRVASTMAVSTFMNSCLANLRADMDAQEVQQVAEFAAAAANSAIYECGQSDDALRGMGTTLVSAIIWGDQALFSNVGDSRAYLIRRADEEGGSAISRITKDHSFVEKLLDMGNITEEEALCHPNRNLVTRVLGPESEAPSDSYLLQLLPGDYILLCTDGLVDTVSARDIEREILGSDDDNTCLDRLLELAKRSGAADNVTAVLIRRQ